MQTTEHFLIMTRDEFRPWLQKQAVSRAISRLQVHHTWSPAYKDIKPGGELKRLESMRDFHMQRNEWKEIGQNITTFPSGLIGISRGRDLNKAPAGIAGANTGAICIENLGNFDIGGDTLTDQHKATIVHLYAALAEKFRLPIDAEHLPYHAWYTSAGDWIGDYARSRSSKTCPGTNFFGAGNTRKAAEASFLPAVRAEYARMTTGSVSFPTYGAGKPAEKPSAAPETIRVTHNGGQAVKGLTYENTVYAPLASMGTIFGVPFGWDNKQKKAYFNGKEIKSATIYDGRAYIPVRPIAESYGAKVEWDGDKTVNIIKEAKK